jgi:hypothetical protein
MDERLNSVLLEAVLEGVAPIRSDYEQMPHWFGPGGHIGQNDGRVNPAHLGKIRVRDMRPIGIPRIKVPKFDPQQGGL